MVLLLTLKYLKTVLRTFPFLTFSVTSAELQTLFGAVSLAQLTFAPNIYVGDMMFEAFPATGSGTGVVSEQCRSCEFARFAILA